MLGAVETILCGGAAESVAVSRRTARLRLVSMSAPVCGCASPTPFCGLVGDRQPFSHEGLLSPQQVDGEKGSQSPIFDCWRPSADRVFEGVRPIWWLPRDSQTSCC